MESLQVEGMNRASSIFVDGFPLPGLLDCPPRNSVELPRAHDLQTIRPGTEDKVPEELGSAL